MEVQSVISVALRLTCVLFFMFWLNPAGNAQSPLFAGTGQTDLEGLGASVGARGDMDGDGLSDVVTGAPAFDGAPGIDSGRVDVLSAATEDVVYSLFGQTAGDRFGESVDFIGDVNGDGLDDVLIGAPAFVGTGGSDTGRAYIYSGSDGTFLRSWDGEAAGDRFGHVVARAGDVDGDSVEDLLVGAPGHDGLGGVDAGKVYLYSGSTGVLLRSWDGEASGDAFGYSVAEGGDFNRDGDADIVIGAPLAFGSAGPASGKSYLYTARTRNLITFFEGEGAGDRFGWSISGGQDLDLDRWSDVVVGAYRYDGLAGVDTGKVYAYSGRNSSLLWSREGEADSGEFGFSVSIGEDSSGDGFPDALVGAPKERGEGGALGGRAYLLSGHSGDIAWRVLGRRAQDELGGAVSLGGDSDGDGNADAVVGASSARSGGMRKGRVYVLTGRDEVFFWTREQETLTGNPVLSGGGDVDGDGVFDVLHGSPCELPGSRGKVYVRSGSTGAILRCWEGELGDKLGRTAVLASDLNGDGFADAVVQARGGPGGCVIAFSGATGEELWRREGEGFGDELGWSISTRADLDGDGCVDVLVGAPFHKGFAGTSSGKVYLYSGKTGDQLWSQEGENQGDQFGGSVALAGDGTDRFYVSAPEFDGDLGPATGKVYAFRGLQGTLETTIESGTAFNLFGWRVDAGGDANGDGLADLLVSGLLFEGGKVFLYSGADLTRLYEWSGDRRVEVRFGENLEIIGDADGDGFDDVAIGSERFSIGTTQNVGRVTAYSGLTGESIKTLVGPRPGSFFGHSLAGVGDVNGDGLADLAIGSRNVGIDGIGKVWTYSLANSVEHRSRQGAVNASSGTPTDVLFVNGSAGNRVFRRVTVTPTTPFEISMDGPPALHAGDTAPFALYVYSALPTAETARKLPLGVGLSSLPMPWTEASPDLVGLWNNTGQPALGGNPLPSVPAPSLVFRRNQGLNREVTFYLQGIIFDPGSSAAVRASVTNGIEVVVEP